MSDGAAAGNFLWWLAKVIFWVMSMGLILERLAAIRDELRKMNGPRIQRDKSSEPYTK